MFGVDEAPCPLALAGDVDVIVSSGSPLDWLGDLSVPTPSGHRTLATGGHETVVEEAPRVFATDVYRFAKITTVDLIGEIPWTVRKDVPSPRAGYPPFVPDDVRWVALAALLRLTLHPALVNESEVEEYLVTIGESSLDAVAMAKVEPGLAAVCKAVTARVSDVPKDAPVPPKGDSPLASMLHRLTCEDLTQSYPFAFDGKFARRISLLGPEMLPYVLEATRSSHSFLRRNAVLMLGRYASPNADERLRELLVDKDSVVQLRALDALARKRDAKSVPIILDVYRKTQSRSLRLSLIRALGLIGDPSGSDAIAKHLAARGDDADDAVTCLIALARIGAKDPKPFGAILDRVKNMDYKDPTSRYGPVTRDLPGTQKATIEQLVLLARASCGDAASMRKVLERQDPWNAPAVFALLTTLARSPKGVDRLFEMAKDAQEDVGVRVRALAEIARIRPPDLAKKSRELVGLDQEFAVAASSLKILAAFAADDAREAAWKVVAAYDPKMSPAAKALVSEAVRYLVDTRAAEAKSLLRIVEHEIILAEKPKPRREDDDPRGKRERSRRLEFESPTTFFEELVAAVGEIEDAAIQPLLIEILSRAELPGRAEAAVGLARRRDAKSARALLAALADDDGWVRFIAYRALKSMLGKDVACDWLYGSKEDRDKAVAEYAEAVQEFGK